MGRRAQGRRRRPSGAAASARERLTRFAATVLLLACAATAQAKTLHVYSSLPLQGAAAAPARDIVRGIRLALREAGGKAGAFDIAYTSLDDSTKSVGNWDPSRTARNARRAARDKATILYIGEFNSGASAISIPILNQFNVSQISPSNTYDGLTTGGPAAAVGDPERWYPTGRRTFVRLQPRDTIQGAALATQMVADGCTKVALANDKDQYGSGMATLVQRSARRLGLRRTGNAGVDGRARNYRALARRYRRAGADCFFFGGVTANGALRLYRDVHAALPAARLYGGDGVCETGLTRHVKAAVRARFACSISTLALPDYPGGAAFLDAFAAMFGTSAPDPYAITGYEAMKLGLETIAALGDRGDRREAVRTALFATRGRSSVLGTYSITRTGDTTIRDFGIYRATASGGLVYDHKVVAR